MLILITLLIFYDVDKYQSISLPVRDDTLEAILGIFGWWTLSQQPFIRLLIEQLKYRKKRNDWHKNQNNKEKIKIKIEYKYKKKLLQKLS